MKHIYKLILLSILLLVSALGYDLFNDNDSDPGSITDYSN